MRLWSIHPMYLDRKRLLGAWRDGLLAQAVLARDTVGYRNHPQLKRFKKIKISTSTSSSTQLKAIGIYLFAIAQEAEKRGYNFNTNLICIFTGSKPKAMISVTEDQLKYEVGHLLNKFQENFETGDGTGTEGGFVEEAIDRYGLKTNPVFYKVKGPVESWEKVLPWFKSSDED